MKMLQHSWYPKDKLPASLLTKVLGDHTPFQQVQNKKISKYFISLENFQPASDNAQIGSKIIVPTHLLNKVLKIHTVFKKDPLTSQIWLDPPPIDSYQCGYNGFFCGKFSSPGDEKKKGGWRIQQRNFWEFSKKLRHISRKKKLEVARFRQGVPWDRQN